MLNTINSRQRVLAATERRVSDRPASSLRFTVEALDMMRRHLGLGAGTTLYGILDELDVDLRWIKVPFIGPADRSTPTLLGEGVDFWGNVMTRIKTPTTTYFEITEHPLAGAECIADIEAFEWPDLEWWDYDAIPDMIEQATQSGERSLLFFAGGAFETPWYIRGMEQFLIDLYTEPELAEAICMRVERYYRNRAIRVLEKANGRIDIVGSGGDIGEQNRMLLSPDIWRRHIKPYSGRLIRTFQKMGYKTFYHSDGAITPVIDDFIGLGLDILDPIQVGAAGMTPAELSPRFADRLTFHGAIDEVELLPNASPTEVYEATRQTIQQLGVNRGYIVSATHMVQGDTPPENIVAMLDAVKAGW